MGQILNFQKSAIFSKRVDNNTEDQIKSFFSVPYLLPNTMHLGHPMIFNHRDITKAYEFIINKFMAKLTTIKAYVKPCWETHLYQIYSCIHSYIYYMSTVLFSKTFVDLSKKRLLWKSLMPLLEYFSGQVSKITTLGR